MSVSSAVLISHDFVMLWYEIRATGGGSSDQGIERLARAWGPTDASPGAEVAGASPG